MKTSSEFQDAVKGLTGPTAPAFALADINALLSRLSPTELGHSIEAAPEVRLSPFLANYVAAMVEAACQMRGTHSPAAFRRRNIFIDASLGDQV